MRALVGVSFVMSVTLVTTAGETQSAKSTLIINAIVVDGSGSPGRRSAVRIQDGKILEIGDLKPTSADQIIDARGRTLAPGFIDTHSHHDRGLLDERGATAVVSQGVTTIVFGQDGSSAFPLADALARFDERPAAVNVASYVGHGTLRRQVMGADFKRPVSAEELITLRELLRTEMAAGALGLSTGLEYDPGIYSKPEEIVELARVLAPVGGRYISHIRSEDRALWDAVDETIDIGRATGIPVQISHIKLAMRGLWGQAEKLIAVLDRARASGVHVTADIYPYTYWQSTMRVLFPERDFENRSVAEFALRELVAPQDLLIVGFRKDPSYVGKTLADIAEVRNTDAPATMMALIKEAGDSGPTVVATSMDEQDIARLMQWPFTNLCSDGELAGGHPRGFGSFPRMLGRYVRERRVLSVEEAVRRMTTLAAANVGIADRGTIAPGQHADLVLFNAAEIADRATTTTPHAMSVGIATVWVNGDVVFNDGVVTGKYPGRVLRRASRIAP